MSTRLNKREIKNNKVPQKLNENINQNNKNLK